MAFWSKLFPNTENSGSSQLERARIFLQETEQLAKQDRKAAMKQIDKKARMFQEAFRFGKPLHEEFRKLFISVHPTNLPDVATLLWDAWKEPKLKDVILEAQKTQEEIIYLSSSGDPVDAVEQLQSLWKFSTDPQLVMVAIGLDTMMVRKSFLLASATALNPETEEIGPELLDFAKRMGFRVLR